MRNIDIRINKEDFKNKLGIKDGIPGKTPTKEELINIIKPLLPKNKKEVIIEKTETIKEKNLTGEQIIKKIKELSKEEKLDISDINKLRSELDNIKSLSESSIEEFRKEIDSILLPFGGTSSSFNGVVTDSTLTGKGTEEDPLHAVGDGIGDMLKSTYDPAGGERQVAFADEIPSILNLEIETSRKATGNSYMEYTLNGSGLITNVDYWTNSGKGTKLFTKIVTYTGVNPTTITMKDELANKTQTTTISYSGSTIINVTKVIS